MNEVTVVQYRPKGLISKSIAWYTRGIYAHSGIMLGDTYYESNSKEGVIKEYIPIKVPTGTDFYKLDKDNNDVVTDFLAMKAFAEAQVGKKYDHRMISAFVTRKTQENRKSSEKWFCSEFVFAVLAKGNWHILQNCQPFQVYPDLISMSPMLCKR